MKITTAAEMREIDRATSERFGVPSLTLMENAGSAIAQFILEEYGQANRIAVVCGKGNNGGDGFVVARKLHRAGRVVEVLLLASASDLRGDALAMFERLPLRPVILQTTQELQAESARSLGNCDLIVDAILGTGFQPPVKGLYADAIAAINRSGMPVVAVDIPSGADSDAMSGQSGEGIARADAIVTFTAPRPAHVFGNLTRGADCYRAHRLTSGGDCLQTQSRTDHAERHRRTVHSTPRGQQQGHVRPCADRGRLAGEVRRSSHGGNGGVARRLRT